MYKLHDFGNLEFEIWWLVGCIGLKRGDLTRVHCSLNIVILPVIFSLVNMKGGIFQVVFDR